MWLIDVLYRVVGDVASTFAGTWPFLVLSILAAAALRVFVGADRLGAALRRHTAVAVVAAVALATLTPFCSCGTTAVVLGLLATASPWAPIVAFMVSSPLTSPSELLLSAGLLGWPFALLFFGGTIVLGLGAGALTAAVERTGWLRGQARTRATDPVVAGRAPLPLSMGPGAAAITDLPGARRAAQWRQFVAEVGTVGRRTLAYFTAYTAVGYLLIELVPTAWVQTVVGGSSPAAVVGAALLGIPLYVNTEGSLPLLRALMDGGMGAGPAMAFLVTGAGTSIGAVTGMLVIARRRVVALTLGALFGGAVGLGLVTSLLLG